MTLQYRPSDGALLFKGCDSRKPLLAECCCFPLVCTSCPSTLTVTLDLDESVDAALTGAHTLTGFLSECRWKKEWSETRESGTWLFGVDLTFAEDYINYGGRVTRPASVW